MSACARCGRGPESCEYCYDVDERDHRTICDCGLEDFGGHLLDCAARSDFRFVVVANYGSENLPREDA